MAHIETISLDELISRHLSDRETSLYYIMAMLEESDDIAEIVEAIDKVASCLGLKRASSNNLSAELAAVQSIPKSDFNLELMEDVLKEAGYE
jgi:hypothetical protein